MAIPNAEKQAMSDAWAARGSWLSLHTDTAGTTGANEATGGGYGRMQTSWTPGSTGVNNGSQQTIACAAGTYKEGGFWSAQTTGTFRGSAAFTGGDVVVSGSGASIAVTPSLTVT